jgi:hypothetical protein
MGREGDHERASGLSAEGQAPAAAAGAALHTAAGPGGRAGHEPHPPGGGTPPGHRAA